MNWYKKAQQNISFEIENSAEMDIFDNKHLQSNDGDIVPNPKSLGVKNYIYFSFIWIPEKDRNKGVAKKLITDFVNKTNNPIFVKLVNSDTTQGTILKDLFMSLGFSIYDQGENYIEMLKK